MDLNTLPKGMALFDGEPNYDAYVELGVMSKEEAEKDKKFDELHKKYTEAVSQGKYDLADEIMKEMDKLT